MNIPPVRDLPLPRLLDHVGVEDGPSCSEEEKDAKRQRSASTTPRSGTLPYEYDKVTGVASVGSHESVRFGEGNDPEVDNTADTVAHHQEEEMNENQRGEVGQSDVTPGVGNTHGGFGSASFRDCLNLATQSTNVTSAPCHSEGDMRGLDVST